jgi:hypothetical protein
LNESGSNIGKWWNTCRGWLLIRFKKKLRIPMHMLQGLNFFYWGKVLTFFMRGNPDKLDFEDSLVEFWVRNDVESE